MTQSCMSSKHWTSSECLYVHMHRVRNRQFRNNSWLLLHDNVPTHCMVNVKQFLASKLISVIRHHPDHQKTSLPQGQTGPKKTAPQ